MSIKNEVNYFRKMDIITKHRYHTLLSIDEELVSNLESNKQNDDAMFKKQIDTFYSLFGKRIIKAEKDKILTENLLIIKKSQLN